MVEQRKTISVPVLAAVGGGAGRSDPKIDESVYQTNKKPEAKVKPTVKVEKAAESSPKKIVPAADKTNPAKAVTSKNESQEPAKKIRKRIEPPPKESEGPAPAKRPPVLPIPRVAPAAAFSKPIHHRSAADIGRSGRPGGPSPTPPQCKYWPNCTYGSRCLFYHPAPTLSSSSSSNPDKYRWSSANASF